MDALATLDNDLASILEKVVVGGDLSKLSAAERMLYYERLCHSLGLNPLTRPFEYITLQGRLTLYARKDCTDQLRRAHAIAITRLERERVGDLYVVTAYAQTADGRTDSDIGAVSLAHLQGEALANALMRAVTKAKRRVTLSICGLGILDESEVEDLPREALEPPAAETARASLPASTDAPRRTQTAEPYTDPVSAFYTWAEETLGLDEAAVRAHLGVHLIPDAREALRTACRQHQLPTTASGLLRLRQVLRTLVSAAREVGTASPSPSASEEEA